MGTKAPNSDALPASRPDTEGEVDLALGYYFNGTTWDRARNNESFTVLASAVRAASNQSADFTNMNARGVSIILNITAVPGVQTITLNVEAKDTLAGVYQTLAFSSAISATGVHIVQVFPGAVETGALTNLYVQGVPLPRTWRVNMTHSGGGNFTYSVTAQYQI